MIQGTVDRATINPTTGASGTSTGMAGDLYTFAVTYFAGYSLPAPAPTLGQTSSPFTPSRAATADDVAAGNNARLKFFQLFADFCNIAARGAVYMQANAKAHVTAESLGLVPAVIAAGQPIDPPSSPVDIPIT